MANIRSYGLQLVWPFVYFCKLKYTFLKYTSNKNSYEEPFFDSSVSPLSMFLPIQSYRLSAISTIFLFFFPSIIIEFVFSSGKTTMKH